MLPALRDIGLDPTRVERTSGYGCAHCGLVGACGLVGQGQEDLFPLREVVAPLGPFHAGDYVYRVGDPFRSLLVIRSGTLKKVVLDQEGGEHVLFFALPGDVIGLNAIYPNHHINDAIALETLHLCRFSFQALSQLASRDPAIQKHLFRLLSKELSIISLIPGKQGAEECLAAFLLELGQRYAQGGFSSTHYRLSMSRSDIASYLRLAPETVSRVLGRFKSRGMIDLRGRELDLLDEAALRKLAQHQPGP